MTQPETPFYNSADGWRWRLVAGNGEIVAASSEAFHDRDEAEANLERTLALANDAILAMRLARAVRSERLDFGPKPDPTLAD